MTLTWINRIVGRQAKVSRARKLRKRHSRQLLLQALESRQLLAGDLMAGHIDSHTSSEMAQMVGQHQAGQNSDASSHAHTSGHAMSGHAAALDLVSLDQATNMVVASGNWSDPNVWQNQTLPAAGARIVIPAGLTLTVDSVMEPEFKTIGVQGSLRFATDVNTELRVDTIVSSPGGRFEMGTADNPIASDVVAKVVFADDGAIDQTWDPQQLSRGAVLLGATEIHGATTTHREALAEFPSAGATEIRLQSAAENWKPGDELVITGTQGYQSDEVRTIASIDGATITLGNALERDHIPPKSDLNVYVANKSRNAQFTSENTEVARRGHIMLMHTLDVDIQNAEFSDLGRTDKSRILDDLSFDFTENAVGNETSAGVVFTTTPGEGTNIRGRYAIHFHRGGTAPNSTPALVAGSVVDGSPGWGFVNHSANVNMLNNVAYGVQGASFYTEAGDEIGSMVGNIAIRTGNPSFTLAENGTLDVDLRADAQDFGVDGDGFWLSGHLVSLQNNVSAGAAGHGIIIWSDGLVEADRGRTTVRTADIENGHLITGRDTIPTWWAPLAEISNNESYGASIGFRSRYVHSQGYLGEIGSDFHTPPDQAYIDTLSPTIDGLTVWGSRDGVYMNYNERMSLTNSKLIGIGATYYRNDGTTSTGVGLDMHNDVSRGPGRIENVTIEGFNMGLLAPRSDDWQASNLQLSNTTDILIREVTESPRTLDMQNVSFGSLAGTAVADQSENRQNVVMLAEFESNPFQPFRFLMADRVSLNGQQLYFNEQAADFIPTAGDITDEPGPVPASMIGLTNQQLQDRFGTSFGGAITPADAVTASFLSGGMVGSPAEPPATTPPIYHPASETAGCEGLIIDPGTLTNFDGPASQCDADGDPEGSDPEGSDPEDGDPDGGDPDEEDHDGGDPDSGDPDDQDPEDPDGENPEDEDPDDEGSDDDNSEDEDPQDEAPDSGDPDSEDDDEDPCRDEDHDNEAESEDQDPDEEEEEGDDDPADEQTDGEQPEDDLDDVEGSDEEDDSENAPDDAESGGLDQDQVPDDMLAGDGDATTDASRLVIVLHNAQLPTDVSGDGFTSAIDALMIVNFLNEGSFSEQAVDQAVEQFMDVNNDGFASAIDVLHVVNMISNRQQIPAPATIDLSFQDLETDEDEDEHEDKMLFDVLLEDSH